MATRVTPVLNTNQNYVDGNDALPPAAAMDMPRQVLENTRRLTIATLMGRLFLRNA